MSKLYIPTLRGYETGQHQLSDLGERTTTDGVPLNTLWTEFTTRLGIFNAASDMVVSQMASETTLAYEKVAIPVRARMEQASENGRPTLVRTMRVTRGYPIERYDIGYGATLEFLDDANADDVRGAITTIEEAYRRKRRQVVYDAIFKSTNVTDVDGINVKRLYNADGEVPPEYESYVHTGSHTHYLTSAGASLVTGDLATLETHLLHHGYGEDTNAGMGGTLVLRVSRTEMATIRGFADFIPAQSASVAQILSNSGVIVGGSQAGPPGTQGYVGRFAIVEDLTIPVGYLLAYAVGGLANEAPVRIRLHSNASARGLRLQPGDNAYPLINSFYDTYLGAGVAHRGAAAVMQVTAGAYTDPTF